MVFIQKKNIMYCILLGIVAIAILGWGYFEYCRGRANDSDVRDAVQDIEGDRAAIECGIDSARGENQQAREQLDDVDGGIDSAQGRTDRMQDQAGEREELIGELRRGNEKCQSLTRELERTLTDIEQQNQQLGAQIDSD